MGVRGGEAKASGFLAVGDGDKEVIAGFGFRDRENFGKSPFCGFEGAREDEALIGEFYKALIFIHLHCVAGNESAAMLADADANAGADGNREAGGAACVT